MRSGTGWRGRSTTTIRAAAITAPLGLLMLMMGDGNEFSWIGGVLLAGAVIVAFAQGFWGDSEKS